MRRLVPVLILLAGCGSHQPPTPVPMPTPPPVVERWQAIAQASHRATDRLAPLDGFVLGDVWGQWLGAPTSIERMVWSLNLTRVGVEAQTFDRWLRGQATVEECLRSPAAFGAASSLGLTTLEQLRIARAIGMRVMVTVDSSHNRSPYHGAPPGGLTDRADTLLVYRGLMGYLAAQFPGTVTHVQIENEPCYRSYMPSQYVSLVRAVLPIIRERAPGVKVLVGGVECGAAVADAGLDVDVLGFHVAVPDPWLTDAQLSDLVRTQAAALARYGLPVWCDECGIGAAPHSAYDAAGARRLAAMIDGCVAGGCDGFLCLLVGGLDAAPIVWEGDAYSFQLFSTNRGESVSAQTVRQRSRRLGVWWASGGTP